MSCYLTSHTRAQLDDFVKALEVVGQLIKESALLQHHLYIFNILQ